MINHVYLHRVQNFHQPIGKMGMSKRYQMRGGMLGAGFMSKFFKNLGLKAAKFLAGNAKSILAPVAKEIAPQAIVAASNYLGKELSRNQAPDGLINFNAVAGQSLARAARDAIKTEKQTPTQEKVSRVISDKAQNLLHGMASRGSGLRLNGSGLRLTGGGLRLMGDGIRNVGGSLELKQAPQV